MERLMNQDTVTYLEVGLLDPSIALCIKHFEERFLKLMSLTIDAEIPGAVTPRTLSLLHQKRIGVGELFLRAYRKKFVKEDTSSQG
jgi:hypothetical protein